jgi:alpha-beta hydrolase superfamily lysophospholipase
VRGMVRQYANQVPTTQLSQALAYFDRCPRAPNFVTGHSLGGALAQLVSQQRGVPAIAFNSPFMGDLSGVVLTSSQLIVQINARGDPLSLATAAAGNLPHGRVITLDTAPFHPGPRLADAPPWWVAAVSPAAAAFIVERDQFQYHRELLSYLGEAMLHYHSMENLMKTIRLLRRFTTQLRPDLSNL